MPRQPDEITLEIDGHAVKCTHLSKVLYPATHFTKSDVIDYYRRVAPVLLPHLANRPVTLKRYPDGVTTKAFYEKNAPSYTPDWVETFPVPRHASGPDIHYILIQNTATLVWAANAAALELHLFLHRAPKISQPTSVVFDLDPGDGADILQCIQVAQWIKNLLDPLGLLVFPKVSGSKGIQLYVPLNTASNYEVTRAFAKTVAQTLEQNQPDLVVSDMAKEKRHGKVFIDWSQNSDFKTTVSVYSLRAKHPQPFVSMPVSWEELEQAFQRKNSEILFFDPKAALGRIEKRGDLFAEVLTLKQKLPKNLA